MSLITLNPTIDLLRDALAELGYSCHKFSLNDRGYTRFTAPNGGTWLTRDATISYPMLNATCQQISADKSLAYELCHSHGIHTPRTITFNDINTRRNELGALMARGPIIIKPSDASLSWGVTLNIRSKEMLEDAFEEAKKFSEVVIAQEQIYGEEIRFAVVDGVAKAALLRQTPRVVGDGESSLNQLIEHENKDRQQLSQTLAQYPILDDKMIDFLQFDMSSVPDKDALIELSKSTMVRGGASMYNVLDSVDPSYRQVAEAAARALGAQFVVVDIMIEDWQQPSNGTNYAFLEFNCAPVLSLFYSCRDGKQYDVVSELAPRIDNVIKSRSI